MSTANLNDMATLANDTVLGQRIFMAMIQFCSIVVPGETISNGAVELHIARKSYGARILNDPNTYKPLFVNAVAANQIVANDATAGGTIVGFTSGPLATAALLCTDTDINNAIAAAFNSFIAQI